MIKKASAKNIFNEIQKNWRSLKWWNMVYIARILPRLLVNKGIYIVNEKWDNLVILDACRYDIFREINTIEGELESRISRGSHTKEFLLENFRNHPQYSSFRDIVYVTANPFVNLLLPHKFYKIYPVWDYGWDDDLNTVPPAYVMKEGLKARQEHPDKRLIIHFMQPHSPFLGTKFVVTGFHELRNAVLENRDKFWGTEWFDIVEKGESDIKEVLFAYKENLRIVLLYVEELIAMLPGRTVVTSDHGELFGERLHVLYPFKGFGHYQFFHYYPHVKQLVLVPWFIVDHEKTKSKI